jgi:hypothetical protein
MNSDLLNTKHKYVYVILELKKKENSKLEFLADFLKTIYEYWKSAVSTSLFL